MKKFEKGFTLIELLVVVAIIGILSSIVLVSLNSARQRGRDASLKGSLSSMRAAAEIIYDETGTYSTVCDEGPPASSSRTLYNAALQQNQDSPVHCQAGTTDWAASLQLNSNAGEWFCADSDGFAGVVTGQPSGTACNS